MQQPSVSDIICVDVLDERGSLSDSCGLTGHQLIVRGRRILVLCLLGHSTVPAHFTHTGLEFRDHRFVEDYCRGRHFVLFLKLVKFCR